MTIDESGVMPEVAAVPEIGVKIHWLAGLTVSFGIFVSLRLWFFMELNRLSTLREIKRVELQIAFLSEKHSQSM